MVSVGVEVKKTIPKALRTILILNDKIISLSLLSFRRSYSRSLPLTIYCIRSY